MAKIKRTRRRMMNNRISNNNNAAPPQPSSGLSDIQKRDLALIWSTHSIGLDTASNGNTDGGDNVTASIPLDNQSFNFVASLTSYFNRVVNQIATENHHDHAQFPNNGDVHDSDNRVIGRNKYSATLDAIIHFFPRLQDGQQNYNRRRSRSRSRSRSNGDEQQLQRIRLFMTTPQIPNGRHVITIDHAMFLNEIQSINNNDDLLRGYGGYLYHKPQYGLCVINSAISLTMITLSRRSSPLTLHHNQQQQRYGSAATTNNVNPQSIIIHTRFHNVYPTIQIHDVKTSNAYKFITLKGRIIKVHSKRLRLYSAEVLCIKCGQQFDHLFTEGRYVLPTKCRAISKQQQQTNSSNNSNKSDQKCRGQKFEIIRRTAKYVDYQKLKLQEEDNFHTSNGNNASSSSNAGGGGGAGGGEAGGRSPRSIDLEGNCEYLCSPFLY